MDLEDYLLEKRQKRKVHSIKCDSIQELGDFDCLEREKLQEEEFDE